MTTPTQRLKVFKNDAAKQTVAVWFDKFRAALTVPTESRLVKTRFGEAHVLVAGAVDAPPLVLLHGALASSAHVLGELERLAHGHRVYAVDVVGQSVKSADERPSVDNDEYGAWLADVVDGLGLDRFFLVGISWGGFVSVRFTKLHPARVRKLVLLVPAGFVSSPHWRGFTRIALPLLLYRLSPTPRRLASFLEHMITTKNDDWGPYLGDAVRSYNMDMRIPALVQPDELRAFQAPTLVIAADNDVSFPGSVLLDRAKTIFGRPIETELLENCTHSPPTTPEFRAFLSGRIARFLDAPL